jgi:hypothetical protein
MHPAAALAAAAAAAAVRTAVFAAVAAEGRRSLAEGTHPVGGTNKGQQCESAKQPVCR